MERNINISFFILSFFLAHFDSHSQIHLKKVKEFSIESFNSIDISDYEPDTRQFLALEQASRGFVVLLLDENGEILLRKDLSGQGPGQINGAFNGLGFSPEGGIWIMSLAQMFYYDKKLNYQKQQRFTSKIQLSMYGNAKLIPYFYIKNQSLNLVFATFPSGGRLLSQSQNLNSEYLLELFDTKKNENYQLAAIKDRSIGNKLDKSLCFIYFPIYSIENKKNLAFVTGSLDNEITVIDTQSGKTLNQIKIDHGEFKSLNLPKLTSDDFPSSGIVTLSSINHKILHLDGGLLLLNYIREIPEQVYNRKRAEDRQYHHFQDPTFHRLILFDQKKQLSGDIPMPKNGHLMISLPENRLLFKIVDPDVEEDFVRYEIYQIVME